MNNRFPLSVAVVLLLGATASAQTYQRRATVSGNGTASAGRCTVEVAVDGSAEIEIRGDSASMRDLSGRRPQWRRFECTGAMPTNPVDFRFRGIDGRGTQELVRDPRNGGAAVVRINDPQGGPEGYTFELTWGGGYDNSRRDDRGPFDQRHGQGRWDTARVIGVCEQSVKSQAMTRFHSGDISFRRPETDNNPGPQDWVTGIIDVRRSPNHVESYRYSCSVNFDTGIVRSMRIESDGNDRNRREYADSSASGTARATESCERAAEERIRREGFDYVDFGSIRIDDQPGRRDSIIGSARANRGRSSTSFSFACSVDLATGNVRSVDLRRR